MSIYNGRIVAVGKGDENNIIYSDNSGVSWTGLGKIFSDRGHKVAYSEIQDQWLAVGQGSSWGFYSSNGIEWDEITSLNLISAYGVATNGNRCVAVGEGSNTNNRSIIYSDNVINGWQNIENSRSDIFTNSAIGVASYGNNWVAVGNGTNHKIAYSSDNAETWTPSLIVDGSNTNVLFTWKGNTIATNGSRWIAGGAGTNSGYYMLLGYSDNNGQTWTKVDHWVVDTFTEIYGSHWDGNRFWLSGKGTRGKLAYSYDGLNWNFF